MAKVRDEQDLTKPDYATVYDHAEELEKRINRVVRYIKDNHKETIWHKIKTFLGFKCQVCEISRELK